MPSNGNTKGNFSRDKTIETIGGGGGGFRIRWQIHKIDFAGWFWNACKCEVFESTFSFLQLAQSYLVEE